MNRKSPLILIWKVTHASNPTRVQVTKALMKVKGVSTCNFLTNLGKHFSITVLLFSKHQIICSMIRSRERYTFVQIQMWRMQSRRWCDFTCPEVIWLHLVGIPPSFLPVFVQLLSHNSKAKHNCCLTATFPRWLGFIKNASIKNSYFYSAWPEGAIGGEIYIKSLSTSQKFENCKWNGRIL